MITVLKNHHHHTDLYQGAYPRFSQSPLLDPAKGSSPKSSKQHTAVSVCATNRLAVKANGKLSVSGKKVNSQRNYKNETIVKFHIEKILGSKKKLTFGLSSFRNPTLTISNSFHTKRSFSAFINRNGSLSCQIRFTSQSCIDQIILVQSVRPTFSDPITKPTAGMTYINIGAATSTMLFCSRPWRKTISLDCEGLESEEAVMRKAKTMPPNKEVLVFRKSEV